METNAGRLIDWEAFVFAGSQRKRVESLMEWANCGKPHSWEVVDDLLRECWRDGFKKGVGVDRMYSHSLGVNEVWLAFAKNRKIGSWG